MERISVSIFLELREIYEIFHVQLFLCILEYNSDDSVRSYKLFILEEYITATEEFVEWVATNKTSYYF